jgi:hypothetical protein
MMLFLQSLVMLLLPLEELLMLYMKVFSAAFLFISHLLVKEALFPATSHHLFTQIPYIQVIKNLNSKSIKTCNFVFLMDPVLAFKLQSQNK